MAFVTTAKFFVAVQFTCRSLVKAVFPSKAEAAGVFVAFCTALFLLEALQRLIRMLVPP